MSRRRVSVKELDPADHQGWLYRKNESKVFLGIKWKKYWFVLKKTSLYWYTNQMAEKADGYINLTDFLIDRAMECKKKYAFKACHPNLMMFYFAAENNEEMNTWLNKLGLAAIQYEPAPSHQAECYSEASDGEEVESTEAPPPPYSEQLTKGPMNTDSPGRPGSLPPPYSSPVPSEATPVSTVTSRGSTSSLAKRRLSWMDLVSQASPASATEALTCSAQVHAQGDAPEEAPQSWGPQAMEHQQDQSANSLTTHNSYGEESAADEMEKLYRDLKKASLSPTGERRPTSRREFRASFIKRCKNNTVNDKLHLIRALNSTLKAKEADVLTLDQVLIDPSLTASKYRRWKESNVVLLQEIHLHQPPQSVPPEAPALTAAATPLTETSV
uniref:PH domain-containing protein n=2 Tax=Electrophorus TaxID=8004 RepID=A0A4W4HGJ4_ELEEL